MEALRIWPNDLKEDKEASDGQRGVDVEKGEILPGSWTRVRMAPQASGSTLRNIQPPRFQPSKKCFPMILVLYSSISA